MSLGTSRVFRIAGSLVLVVAALGGCPAARGGSEPRLPADLLARAETEGSVRVIAELRVVSGDIGAAQNAVLQALAGAPHRILRRYATVPFLALEVSPEALRLLAASPAVLRIQEDRVAAPQRRAP